MKSTRCVGYTNSSNINNKSYNERLNILNCNHLNKLI